MCCESSSHGPQTQRCRRIVIVDRSFFSTIDADRPRVANRSLAIPLRIADMHIYVKERPCFHQHTHNFFKSMDSPKHTKSAIDAPSRTSGQIVPIFTSGQRHLLLSSPQQLSLLMQHHSLKLQQQELDHQQRDLRQRKLRQQRDQQRSKLRQQQQQLDNDKIMALRKKKHWPRYAFRSLWSPSLSLSLSDSYSYRCILSASLSEKAIYTNMAEYLLFVNPPV